MTKYSFSNNIIDNLDIISKKNKMKNSFNKINKKPLLFNSIFFKNLSFKYYENSFLFNSGSSSIIKHPKFGDRYILNIRCNNYYLKKNGSSSIKSNQKTITSNCICIINNNLDVIYKNIFRPNLRDNIPYVGIEDIRIFSFKDKMYYIGSAYDNNTNKIKISSFELKLHENYKINFIEPNFSTSFNWEKNWVFFENNNEMFVIYKWNPIYICKIDYNTNKLDLIKSIPTNNDFTNLRGSTNGVFFDDKIWFIVHCQIDIYGVKNYFHRFVTFNNDLSIYGYSNMFKFEGYLIEFCIGMEISYRNNFLITYSTLDSTTKLIVVSYDTIKNLLIN